jgi:hypothetical protein
VVVTESHLPAVEAKKEASIHPKIRLSAVLTDCYTMSQGEIHDPDT